MSNSILVNLKHSYAIVPIAIIVALILIYLDSLVNKKELTKKDYLKYALIVGGISSFIVYVNTMEGKIEEEILAGPAPF
jgi:hypothetical protein